MCSESGTVACNQPMGSRGMSGLDLQETWVGQLDWLPLSLIPLARKSFLAAHQAEEAIETSTDKDAGKVV